MNKGLLLYIFLLLNICSYAQCNCNQINKGDEIISQCIPQPIAEDRFTQVGIAFISTINRTDMILSGRDKSIKNYISVSVRFDETSLELTDNLEINLLNGTAISLKLLKSGENFIGGSEVVNAVYPIEKNLVDLIKKSKINTIGLHFENDILRMYRCDFNQDVLMEQIKCIENGIKND
ncbi:hypothetical protein GM418_13950 [Maribellus comscasis]|uniref:Uncharacterized protein n=1 Tax=Maribellus comscasis TaxID=2681766 RepID=A0A6I6JUI0_9BACT|nr:hypothetical protein [Maribellus comscasis]QGY44730.1 hypothetical protein GM418_13950 [Maribellus comscasis]